MQKINVELQEYEKESGYLLKTNDQIIEDITDFGYGEMEVHSLDLNRLVVENERAKKLIQYLQHLN